MQGSASDPFASEMSDYRLAALFEEVLALRTAIAGAAAAQLAAIGASLDDPDPALVNLSHYLALRHQDVRMLQRTLMRYGLSSLGRLESRVLPTLDAVLYSLAALTGRQSPFALPDEAVFFAGEARLDSASTDLFGAPAGHRRTRIMVTLPSEAATDFALVHGFAKAGMDIARINCAHDTPDAWQAMADNVRKAGGMVGRRLKLFMDIAGPKIRTDKVALPDKKARVHVGDAIALIAEGKPKSRPEAPFAASVSLPELVGWLKVGARVRYDDLKLEGIVEAVEAGEARVRVTQTKAAGTKLRAEKGLNLPDTALGLLPLTAQDEENLGIIVGLADMIGYSFVSQPDDIDLLDAAIVRHGRSGAPFGIVAKIERPEAVKNLPAIIARARGRGPFGVMIARGDLASEIGFTRLAEMQEEILWICEAASVPAIWATQVLEDLVKDGVPSRGEMTDAAMAARAECVMLNKGESVKAAIELLDGLLERMDAHIFKKTPILRPLKSW